MVLSEKVEFLSTFILPVLNEEIFQKYKLSIFACFVNSVCVVLQFALDVQIMIRQKFIGWQKHFRPFLTWVRCLRCHFFRGTQRCTPSSLDRNQACRWRNTELSENVPSQDCNKGKENGVLMKHKWRSIDTHECLPYLIFESHTF